MQTLYTTLLILSFLISPSFSVPLSTKSRWIIDDITGDRVKLVGGNWAGHVGPMLPEGLDKRPLSEIARHIALMGFNSVRLTYATYMYTRYSDVTVLHSLRNSSLFDAIDGVAKYNPELLGLTLPEAQEVVVKELGLNGVMTVLDNQVSLPIWCCADDDGNGFWGDKYFDPDDWLKSLHMVAHRYKHNPMVVAMSLRNELRGDRQNAKDWYRYVHMGVNRIHKSNPNVLILVSGLSYSLDFTPLKISSLYVKKTSKLNHKIVYEAHRYAFTMGQSKDFLRKPLNQFCDSVVAEMENRTTFLTKGANAAPLYITEFGVNMLGNNTSDNMFLSCFLAYLAKHDLDWNIWALQGSYYLRDSGQDAEEQYGIFTSNWTQIRNPDIHAKFLSVQQIIKEIHLLLTSHKHNILRILTGQHNLTELCHLGFVSNTKFSRATNPNSVAPHYLRMYHPTTGRCFSVNDHTDIHATDCHRFSKWTYEQSTIRLKGTPFCLAAVRDDLPLFITSECNNTQSTWQSVSSYQMGNKDNLCIHYDPHYSPYILAKKCICASSRNDSSCVQNPQNQWVLLLSSNALE